MVKRNPDDNTELLRAISRCWLSMKQTGRSLLREHDYDLTIEQLMVLFILEDKDGQNLRVLAELADRERTTMTRMIDGLERRNLVVRVPDKTDGRNKLVYLTRQGRSMTKKVEELRQQFDTIIINGLKKKEIEQATRILHRVSKNLGFVD